MGNLPEDIERMIRYLGREDPGVQRLIKVYIRDLQMRQTVRNLLKRRCVRAGFDPDDPPVFWPVRKLPPGKLQVGHVVQGASPGPHLSLPTEIVNQHMGTFGHNGTGKSYLAMHLVHQAIKEGLTVWVFDIEDEYCRLIPQLPAGQLLPLEPEQLRFNIFQPPGEWITPVSWLSELNLFLRGGTFLRDGSLNVFRLGMRKLLEQRGIAKGDIDWPSLLEVIAYFDGLRFGPKSRTAGFLESLLNRLSTLSDMFDKTTRVTKSNMLENLARRSVIFRLHSLVGIPLQSLVSFLLLWLARFREGSSDNKPHMVVIEEAHMLASEKSRQDIGEGILSRMFRTARKRGIALVLCDQVPSELPPAILGNLACRIVMRLANARCIWSVQSSMGLNKRQAEVIATMEPRRAIVHYTLHPTPFEVEISQLSFPERPQESEMRSQAEDFASQSEWTECKTDTEKATASTAKVLAPDDLAGDALLVMMRICQEPAESIEQRCQFLRMVRAREFRARAELDDRGLVAKIEQNLARGIRLFKPTDKGTEWAQKRNIRIKKFKSGIIHEYLLCQVERGIGLTDSKLRLQRNSSIARDQGLQPDLLVMGSDGERIVAEICCNNFDYDAKNILIEMAIPTMDHVIAITPDKRTKNLLKQALEKDSEDSSKDWQKLVTLLDAGQCLVDKFDWAKVLAAVSRKLFPDSSPISKVSSEEK